ncbi:MAG: RNA polymerase sigma factor [Bacteroidota bacterium]|jgi:RNA polymerase sigma-70 factor (ECF subfamily)|nr:sigma-70 family RNA polymerase sigma factor [Chitinophagaceae bacterium]
MTEEILIIGCQEKNPQAQQELYQRFSPKMLSVCYRYAKSREDAEDMLQEGFIKVFTQINQFEQRGSLEGWILKTIVHTCINHLKKYKKFTEHVDLIHAEALMSNQEYLPGMLQAKQIIECIRQLPIGYRTVLNLFALEGYSHREIGRLLDIEESTSRSQYTRAKTMLEDILVKKNIMQQKKEKNKWLVPVNG